MSSSLVCCGCQKQITNSAYRTFDDSVSFNSNNKSIRLKECMETIIGCKVPETDSFSNLCESCFVNLKFYTEFRMQLLSSFKTLAGKNSNTNVPKYPSTTRIEETHGTNGRVCMTPHAKPINDTPKAPINTEVKIITEDIIINVDENSVPLDLGNSQNDESCTNDSLDDSNKLQINLQENNNLNDSEVSNDPLNNEEMKTLLSKVQDNDIESEIDVCSGDDHEVLELDIQSRKDETLEIGSSSESDIEVCDYEPTGKRIRSYNTLTPPVDF